jgi:hypothetical protein
MREFNHVHSQIEIFGGTGEKVRKGEHERLRTRMYYIAPVEYGSFVLSNGVADRSVIVGGVCVPSRQSEDFGGRQQQ